MYTGISASAVTATLRLKTQIRPEVVLHKAFVRQTMTKTGPQPGRDDSTQPKVTNKKKCKKNPNTQVKSWLLLNLNLNINHVQI